MLHRAYSLFLILVLFSSPLLANSLGIEPVTSPVVEFTLPTFQGPDLKLSSYKNKPILLFFWATWCGPCQSELPLINTFARLHKKQMEVVSVNVDSGQPDEVKKLIRDTGITTFHFPVALDPDNSVARKYQASSLPTAYLIHPKWKIVGMIRGARNWEDPQILPELLQFINGAPDNSTPAATASEQIDLEPKIQPPTLKLEWMPPIEGQLGVNLWIEWPGALSQYVFKTPSLVKNDKELPCEIESVATEASSQIAASSILYRILLKCPSISKLNEVGPFELAYTARGFDRLQYVKSETLKVPATPTKINKKEITIIGTLVTILLVAAFYVWSLRKNKKVEALSSSKDLYQEKWSALLRFKVNGQLKEYQLATLELMIDLKLQEDLQKEMEQIKFAGTLLDSAKIDYYIREIEKAIQKENRDG